MRLTILVFVLLYSALINAQNWQPFQLDSTVYFIGKYSRKVEGYRLDSIKNNRYFGHLGIYYTDKNNSRAYPGNWFAVNLYFQFNKLLFLACPLGYDNSYALSDKYFRLNQLDTLYFYNSIGTESFNVISKNKIVLTKKTLDTVYSGQVDSCLTYFTTDIDNNIDTLIISKNYGIIRWFGSMMRVKQVPLITNKMMNNFNVGDIKHYEFSRLYEKSVFHGLEIKKKEFIDNFVIYTIERIDEYYQLDSIIKQEGFFASKPYITKDTLKFDNSPFIENMYYKNQLIIPDEILLKSNPIPYPYKKTCRKFQVVLSKTITINENIGSMPLQLGDTNYFSIVNSAPRGSRLINSCLGLEQNILWMGGGSRFSNNYFLVYANTQCDKKYKPHVFNFPNYRHNFQLLKNNFIQILGADSTFSFVICDAIGREIKKIQCSNSTNIFYLGKIKSEIYFIHLRQNGKTIRKEKFISIR